MKKTILFINGHMNTGGVEKSLLDTLCNIDYTKYDVDLLLFEDLGDYVSFLPKEVNVVFKDIKNSYGSIFNATVKCIQKNDWFCLLLRFVFLLQKLFKDKKLFLLKPLINLNKTYDYAIAYRNGFCTDVLINGVDSRKKITWWHHGEISFNDEEFENFENVLRQVDKVVSVSEPCNNILKELFPTYKNKFVVIPNMINEKKIIDFSKESNPYSDINQKKVIVSVGRIAPEKHFENVVFATKQLLERGFENFLWYIVGGDWEFEKVKNLIKVNQLEEYVFMVGKKSNPYPYIYNADLYVHTSYVESQGLTILEAMLLECPCVITKSLGACTIVKNYYNGILVEQNVDSLVEGIIDIYNRENSDFIENGKETVKQYYPEKIMQEFYNLLEL